MKLITLMLILVGLSGCNLTTVTEVQDTLHSPPTEVDDDSWDTLATGFEQRTLRTENNILIRAIRIDPAYYTFHAHYNTTSPFRIDEWRNALPNPTAIINANFFGTQNEVLGLLISDGAVFGRSYQRGGTFIVQNGVPRIRHTPDEPYYAGEPMQQAVQAFPMLVRDGQQHYYSDTDFIPSRRSAIGQDSQGRIVIFATISLISLPQFSEYLANEASLDLVNAFNLDGGGSTMLYSAPADFTLRSIDPVPAVLAVYPKSP